MARVSLHLHGALVDFALPRRGPKSPELVLELEVEPHRTLKDILEAVGVPHVELARVTVNGESAELSARPSEGDVVSAHPHEPGADGSARLAFLLDGHLAALARHLRLLGFDAECSPDEADPSLARRSAEEGRILLTRDVGLLKRRLVARGYWVRSTDPDEQLTEVICRYNLGPHANPFSRCLRCNGTLVDVRLAAVLDRVPPYVAKTQKRFRECTRCGGVYWEGTHHARLQARCDRVLK